MSETATARSQIQPDLDEHLAAIFSLPPEDQLLVLRLIKCIKAVPDGEKLDSYAPTKEIVSAFMEKNEAGTTSLQDFYCYVDKLEQALNIPTDPCKIRYDFRDLRQKILDRYGTLKAFSADMGVHPSTLRRWLKNVSYMPVQAINKMLELLDIPEADVQRFFFTLESDAYMHYIQLPAEHKQTLDFRTQ